MGGNALHGLVPTRRYSAKEYHELVPEVVQLARLAIGEGRVEVIPAYKSKTSFGDMDVLLEIVPSQLDKIRDDLCSCFGVRQIYTDGKPVNLYNIKGAISSDKVYSIGYKELQIDFILSSPETFEAAYNYFSWNDLGNLLGRVAHKFGFKLGHEGLVYPFRSGDQVWEELVVERDWDKILPAFDWDPERFKQGFEDISEIFEYVSSSKFFNPDIYLLDNRNAKSRIRDSKRQTYCDFLKWCEVYQDKFTQYSYEGEKISRLPIMFDALRFSNFKEKYDASKVEFDKYQLFKTRFNGDLVRDLTGRDHLFLGELMKYIKSGWSSETSLQNWVLSHGDKDVELMIKSHDTLLLQNKI